MRPISGQKETSQCISTEAVGIAFAETQGEVSTRALPLQSVVSDETSYISVDDSCRIARNQIVKTVL